MLHARWEQCGNGLQFELVGSNPPPSQLNAPPADLAPRRPAYFLFCAFSITQVFACMMYSSLSFFGPFFPPPCFLYPAGHQPEGSPPFTPASHLTGPADGFLQLKGIFTATAP